MPGPIVAGSQEQWERVAHAVRNRRLALGLTQDDLGVSKAVISNLENAKQERYSAAKLISIATSLGWSSDSIERLLADDAPLEQAGARPDRFSLADEVARMRSQLQDALARIEQLEAGGDKENA